MDFFKSAELCKSCRVKHVFPDQSHLITFQIEQYIDSNIFVEGKVTKHQREISKHWEISK